MSCGRAGGSGAQRDSPASSSSSSSSPDRVDRKSCVTAALDRVVIEIADRLLTTHRRETAAASSSTTVSAASATASAFTSAIYPASARSIHSARSARSSVSSSASSKRNSNGNGSNSISSSTPIAVPASARRASSPPRRTSITDPMRAHHPHRSSLPLSPSPSAPLLLPLHAPNTVAAAASPSHHPTTSSPSSRPIAITPHTIASHTVAPPRLAASPPVSDLVVPQHLSRRSLTLCPDSITPAPVPRTSSLSSTSSTGSRSPLSNASTRSTPPSSSSSSSSSTSVCASDSDDDEQHEYVAARSAILARGHRDPSPTAKTSGKNDSRTRSHEPPLQTSSPLRPLISPSAANTSIAAPKTTTPTAPSTTAARDVTATIRRKPAKSSLSSSSAASLRTPDQIRGSGSAPSPPSPSPAPLDRTINIVHCQNGARPILELLLHKYRHQLRHVSDASCRLLFTDIRAARTFRSFSTIASAPSSSASSSGSSSSPPPPASPVPPPAIAPHHPIPPRLTNHFPELQQIVTKKALGRHLAVMHRLFPLDYDFFPLTLDLPDSLDAVREGMADGKTYIVKPSRGRQGEGISLVQRMQDVQAILHANPARSFVAQEYIANPMLIDGYKFDFRVYVLLESLCPLKAHVFKDGLARLCTEPYEAPSARNLQDVFMHLTNYSLNKSHSSFKKASSDDVTSSPRPAPPLDSTSSSSASSSSSTSSATTGVHVLAPGRGRAPSTSVTAHEARANPSPSPPPSSSPAPSLSPQAPPTQHHHHRSSHIQPHLDTDSSKRSIRTILTQLHQHQGSWLSPDQFWSSVNEIVEKTLMAMWAPLFGAYVHQFPHAQMSSPSPSPSPSPSSPASSSSSSSTPSPCFHLLGFDLLLDAQHKMWLLEVNASPSFAADSPLDWRIKHSVLERCLEIVGLIDPFSGNASASATRSFRATSSGDEDGSAHGVRSAHEEKEEKEAKEDNDDEYGNDDDEDGDAESDRDEQDSMRSDDEEDAEYEHEHAAAPRSTAAAQSAVSSMRRHSVASTGSQRQHVSAHRPPPLAYCRGHAHVAPATTSSGALARSRTPRYHDVHVNCLDLSYSTVWPTVTHPNTLLWAHPMLMQVYAAHASRKSAAGGLTHLAFQRIMSTCPAVAGASSLSSSSSSNAHAHAQRVPAHASADEPAGRWPFTSALTGRVDAQSPPSPSASSSTPQPALTMADVDLLYMASMRRTGERTMSYASFCYAVLSAFAKVQHEREDAASAWRRTVGRWDRRWRRMQHQQEHPQQQQRASSQTREHVSKVDLSNSAASTAKASMKKSKGSRYGDSPPFAADAPFAPFALSPSSSSPSSSSSSYALSTQHVRAGSPSASPLASPSTSSSIARATRKPSLLVLPSMREPRGLNEEKYAAMTCSIDSLFDPPVRSPVRQRQ